MATSVKEGTFQVFYFVFGCSCVDTRSYIVFYKNHS